MAKQDEGFFEEESARELKFAVRTDIIIMIIIINKNVFLFSAKRELSLWRLTAADSGKR